MPYDKADLLATRGQYCECGCLLFCHDVHHFAVPNLKWLRENHNDWVSDERNVVLLNHSQHISRMFDCQTWRVKFWKIQVLRYGEKAMMEWVKSAPAKLDKSRFDFLRMT
jgi:hypothetical protein